MKKQRIGLAFLVMLLAGAALVMPAQAAAEIRNLNISPDPVAHGQTVTVTFQGRVTTAWQTFFYAIAFSTDATSTWGDDWVVEEDGIYDSSMATISHDVNGSRRGFQEDADPGTWYDYSLEIKVPSDYDGDYYVNVIAGENYLGCQQWWDHWEDESSLAFTVEPIVTSCDVNGNEVNQFASGDDVYVKAEGFEASTAYKIGLQDNPVNEGNALVPGEDPSGTLESVTTDGSGNFRANLTWAIPSNASVTHHEYDIVVNKGTGEVNQTYNAADDGLDATSVAGIVAPVPDVSAIILFASGLVVVVALVCFAYGRRRRRI